MSGKLFKCLGVVTVASVLGLGSNADAGVTKTSVVRKTQSTVVKSQKQVVPADCKRAVKDALVNCGAAVVTGGAAVVGTEPPASVVLGVGIPTVVCVNEAEKVIEACTPQNTGDAPAPADAPKGDDK